MIDFFTSQFGFSILLAAAAIGVILFMVAYCIYYERKIAGWVQDRYGPNRVGPVGLLQPIADGGKFVFKEEFIPANVDKPLYVLAPVLIFAVALMAFAVIPWGGQLDFHSVFPGTFEPGERVVNVQVAAADIGLLYILAVLSIGVYGIVLGGWASNNKYSFYGAMRACAQMLSYEIPLGLCILVVVLTAGSLRLEQITVAQTGDWLSWNVCRHPVAFFVLFVTALAEANRTPFDLPEAEQELVGGYHTEYGAMKFALFFLAEYAAIVTTCAMMSVLFLGGWHLPWLTWTQAEATGWWPMLVKIFVILAKTSGLIFMYMWIRWTIPRFRFDQLMRFAWLRLVPMSLGLVVLTVVLLYFGLQRSWPLTLIGNVVVVVIAFWVTTRSSVPVTGRQANMPAAAPYATRA